MGSVTNMRYALCNVSQVPTKGGWFLKDSIPLKKTCHVDVLSISVWMIPSSSAQVWFASKLRHCKNAVVVLQMDCGSTCMCCCWPGTAPIGALASIGIQRLRYLSPCPPRPTHTIPLVQHPNGRIPNLQHLTLFHPNLDPLEETLSLGLRSQWLIFCKLVLWESGRDHDQVFFMWIRFAELKDFFIA